MLHILLSSPFQLLNNDKGKVKIKERRWLLKYLGMSVHEMSKFKAGKEILLKLQKIKKENYW